MIHAPKWARRPAQCFARATRPRAATRSWVAGSGLLLAATAAQAGTDVLVNNPAQDATANNTQSGVVMTRTNASTLVAAFNDSGSFAAGGNRFTGYARSTDGGSTWTDLGALPAHANGDAGFPWLGHHNASGTTYLSTLQFSGNGIQMFRSFDDGLTFAAPVNAGPGSSGFIDKPTNAIDNFAGAGNGNVYVAGRDFGVSSGIKFWRSTDGGATFGPNGGLTLADPGSGNLNGPVVTVGPDHSTYVAWFDETAVPETIKIRRSTDAGLTFGAPVTATTLGTGAGFNGDLGLTGVRSNTVTPEPFRSNALPQLAANPVSGHLYLVYPDNPAGGDKADIFLRQSTDGGATWSAALRVNNDATTNDQWQPTLAVTPDGSRLGVFWYDRRLDVAGNNLIDYFGEVFSIDGGTGALGATGNFRISDVSFLPEFGRDSVVNPLYMGDYDASAQADNNFFYVAWGDNRDPFGTRNDVNVRSDRFPVPEPGGLAALAAVLVGISRRGRRA